MEVWINLYLREFLQKENLYFVEGLLHEDEEFTPKMLWKASRVKLINNFGYIYRQREESIMMVRPKLQYIESILFIIDTLIEKYYVANTLKEKLICSRLIKYLTECYEWKLLISDIEDKKIN